MPDEDDDFERHIGPLRDALAELLEASERLRLQWGSMPNAESTAMAELAEEHRFRGNPTWGETPVTTAHNLAELQLYGASDCAQAAVDLLKPDMRTPVYSHTVLARATLEHAGRAWWLLDPTIGVRLRIARAATEHIFSLSQQMPLLDKARRGEARVKRAALLDEAERLGFQKVQASPRVPPSLEEERPGQTKLVKALFGDVESGGVTYGFFSAVAHATTFGLSSSVTLDAPNMPKTPGVIWGAVYTGSHHVVTVLSAMFLGMGEAFKRRNELFGWRSDAWDAAWLRGLDVGKQSLPS